MKINPKINATLKEFNIDLGLGTLVLLAVYHKLDVKMPELVEKQVNLTKIVTRDYNNREEPIWNVPLYEGEEATDTAWLWVEDFRKKFGAVRTDAIGNKKNCTEKLKKFFAKNPHVRVEDVMKAADMYIVSFMKKLKNPGDVQYFQRADYFVSKIVKGEGSVQYDSRLEMYLELMKKQQESNVGQPRAKSQLL